MNKCKLNKMLLGISLATIAFASNIQNCYAYKISFGTLSDNTEGGEQPYIPSGDVEYTRDKKMFRYSYVYQISSGVGMELSGYNLNGINIMETEKITQTIKSGTWIGINITETQTASWDIKEYAFKEIRKEYTCVYSKEQTVYECDTENNYYIINKGDPCPETNCTSTDILGKPEQQKCKCSKPKYCTQTYNNQIYEPKAVDYNDSSPCPEKKKFTVDNFEVEYILNTELTTSEDVEVDVTDNNDIDSMKKEARDKISKEAMGRIGEPIGMAKYIKNNDYPTTGTFTKNDKADLPVIKHDMIIEWETSDRGSATRNYEYREQKVCMNVKNAKVTYGRDCNENEINIPNKTINGNITYWHYFIPLNTKSGTKNFYLEIVGNVNRPLSVEECKDVIKRYPDNYPDIIIPNLNGDKFYLSKTKKQNEKIITDNKGCYFANTIYIPTVQKFYNEVNVDDTIKIKGFNFYYKPIPTNLSNSDKVAQKVFPNGVGDNSIWKDWYNKTKNEQKVSPDLTNQSVTYIANINNNIHTIRNHNIQYPYTTWEKMSISGASSFITNNKDVFTVQDDNYYKLGCGPANDDTTDAQYQGWCSTK